MRLALTVLSMLPQVQDPAPGIALELARARAAQIANLRYELAFALTTPVATAECAATLRFSLGEDGARGPLVVDFEGEVLEPVLVNGASWEPVKVADHLVVPGALLRKGDNELRLRVRSAVAPSGTPLTVYRDPSDGSEYCYTLVVPADAHRLYPCFDQPDLKAVFDVSLEAPAAWSAIGNGKASVEASGEGRRRWTFATTKKLPTYLMAFACGPFAVAENELEGVPGIAKGERLRTWYRANDKERIDVPALAKLHAEGLRWLCSEFDVPYPFDKLDIVLLPGFPYGGMEHAGAIFYRERALSFDHAPTAAELVRRSTLVYHELSHQWFGNLVTMKWFDDLWLKEGFATFVAHRAMEALEPGQRSWLRFLQRVKPRAYEVDATPGSVPVFQELGNLADAKSNYGPIVYNKAPAVLRELSERLGIDVFRAGVTRFLRRHAFGNAEWRDLAQALGEAAETDLGRWSDRWLLSRSLPRIRVAWDVDADGKVKAATLRQEAVGTEGGTWPVRLELVAITGKDADGRRTFVVESDGSVRELPEVVGLEDVVAIVANPRDVAYGVFLADPRSLRWAQRGLLGLTDPMLRAVFVGSMFESVREAEWDPLEFAELVVALLAQEADPDTHGWLLELLGTTLGRYLDEERGAATRQRATEGLLAQLRSGKANGTELQTFRWIARQGRSPEALALCAAVAQNDIAQLPDGLRPGAEDRYLALAALFACGSREQIEEAEKALVRDAKGEDRGRETFLARAARPARESKEEYFAAYLRLQEPPEQWAQDSLPFFHWPGQARWTRPFLGRALEAASWVKQHRRIFFMPAWLEAFVNGCDDAAALQEVDAFLGREGLDEDIRRKLLQARDGLERSVRVRAKFGARK